MACCRMIICFRNGEGILICRAREVKEFVRTIPDFPKPGIQFRDVTTLFMDARGLRMAVDQLLHPYSGEKIDKVAALEARGFVIGGAIAHQISAGFVLIRKKGKLPGPTLAESYELEYGSEVMEIHDDAVSAGERVLLIDDLLATGGTAAAGISCLSDLERKSSVAPSSSICPTRGRRKLENLGYQVHFLCEFEGD